jgi:hypothetical protein
VREDDFVLLCEELTLTERVSERVLVPGAEIDTELLGERLREGDFVMLEELVRDSDPVTESEGDFEGVLLCEIVLVIVGEPLGDWVKVRDKLIVGVPLIVKE